MAAEGPRSRPAVMAPARTSSGSTSDFVAVSRLPRVGPRRLIGRQLHRQPGFCSSDSPSGLTSCRSFHESEAHTRLQIRLSRIQGVPTQSSDWPCGSLPGSAERHGRNARKPAPDPCRGRMPPTPQEPRSSPNPALRARSGYASFADGNGDIRAEARTQDRPETTGWLSCSSAFCFCPTTSSCRTGETEARVQGRMPSLLATSARC